MIHVSKGHFNEVEYLIGQSIQGNHVLFDVADVREVFQASLNAAPKEMTAEEAYGVEHHIERLMLQPTLAHKRAYLDQLDKKTFAHVVKTYFCIIESNIYQGMEVHH